MEEILACRLCLSTDVKLFNMFKYGLNMAYENLTGFEMTASDGFQNACNICSALLLKSASFQQTCRNSQDLLKFAEMQEHVVTTEYIQSLKIMSPLANFTTQLNETTIQCIHIEEQDLKEESYWAEWDGDEVFKMKETESSDEEPLSSIIVKKSSDFDDVKDKKVRDKIEIKLEKKQLNNDMKNSDVLIKTELMSNENYEVEKDFRDGEVDIIVLTKEQQIEEIESRKTSLNYLNSYYKCDKCFKGFITDATYKNHMVRHDPSSGAHVCEICHTRWSNVRSLRAHLATSHERKFVCKLCNFVSKSRHRAKEHSKWHSGHIFVCKFCGASFSKSTSHLTHIRLHHPSKHTCEVCGESFIGENGLNMHKKKAHRDVKTSKLKAETKCSNCNTQFQDIEALNRHVTQNKCDINVRACVKCGDGFNSEKELKEHLKVHSKEERVKCEECDRVFAHSRSYSLHYQRAHFSCPARDKPTSRAQHVVCEICGKKCISNATLRYHQRTHTGERPYQCTECPKRFSVFQRLQIHRRTHTGERPYKCILCPKAFKHKAALNRHDRVHTGAKPYSCAHCGKSFSQSNSMKLHARTVHLKLPSPYRARRAPAD